MENLNSFTKRRISPVVLVPKLQLGNSVREAPASRLAKLELRYTVILRLFVFFVSFVDSA
jgi:hypothetical protein